MKHYWNPDMGVAGPVLQDRVEPFQSWLSQMVVAYTRDPLSLVPAIYHGTMHPHLLVEQNKKHVREMHIWYDMISLTVNLAGKDAGKGVGYLPSKVKVSIILSRAGRPFS
jgi:hypothetical protein